jgi:hypothetical protein
VRLIRRLPGASALLALAAFLLSQSAKGAPCGVPEVVATFPRANALRVPSNATLAAHYGAPAEYDGEPVTLTASNGALIALSVAHDEAEGLLRATPVEPLVAGSYAVEWPALRGPATGAGRSKTIEFSVVAAIDQAPPSFDGLQSVAWDLAREKDPCTDAPEDRYVFDFVLGTASDDAGPGHLALLVFETEHPRSGPSTPPKQIGIYALPDDGVLHVPRSARRSGKSCFAAVTRDLVGFVSAGGHREVCVETIEPPWFEGCALAPGRSHGSASVVGVLVLVGVVRRRRGSRGTRARPA